jgi:hypothetical protein
MECGTETATPYVHAVSVPRLSSDPPEQCGPWAKGECFTCAAHYAAIEAAVAEERERCINCVEADVTELEKEKYQGKATKHLVIQGLRNLAASMKWANRR